MKGCIRRNVGQREILFASLLIVLINGVHSQDQSVPFTPIPDAEKIGAVCNDGSPAGYYFVEGSGDGVNNWLVYLEGGGWCSSIGNCDIQGDGPHHWGAGQFRTSTLNKPMNFAGFLSSNQRISPDFYNWNRVYLHYCDGGSFLGDTQQEGHPLRGSVIFNAVMDLMLAKGMQSATNAMISGSSAGGLATMLHCDIFRALLPNATRLKCLSDSGFFLRAPEINWADHREDMFVRVLEYRNLTNKLPITCTSTNASLCMFPEFFAAGIKTPLFILNSAFDSYQITDNLKPVPEDQEGWKNCTNDLTMCKPSHKQLITAFGKELIEQVKKLGNNPSNGLYINSCYIHGYTHRDIVWNSNIASMAGNKTIAQAVGDWYFDRSPVNLIDTSTEFPVNCSDSN